MRLFMVYLDNVIVLTSHQYIRGRYNTRLRWLSTSVTENKNYCRRVRLTHVQVNLDRGAYSLVIKPQLAFATKTQLQWNIFIE